MLGPVPVPVPVPVPGPGAGPRVLGPVPGLGPGRPERVRDLGRQGGALEAEAEAVQQLALVGALPTVQARALALPRQDSLRGLCCCTCHIRLRRHHPGPPDNWQR